MKIAQHLKRWLFSSIGVQSLRIWTLNAYAISDRRIIQETESVRLAHQMSATVRCGKSVGRIGESRSILRQRALWYDMALKKGCARNFATHFGVSSDRG